jgi:hypothetical protein
MDRIMLDYPWEAAGLFLMRGEGLPGGNGQAFAFEMRR